MENQPLDQIKIKPNLVAPNYNVISFYFGRITERPTDHDGKPLNVKPIISSNVIAIAHDILIDNAFVSNIESSKGWRLYSFTDEASEWLKAPYMVSVVSDDGVNTLYKWFFTQNEAFIFCDSL